MAERRWKLALCPLLLIAWSAAGAKDLLCAAEGATGFRYNPAKQKYEAAAFNVRNQRWLVRTPNPNDTPYLASMLYAVYRPETNFPQYWCELPADVRGILRCRSGFGTFEVNVRTLRYLATYSGYWTDLSEGSTAEADSPRIEIGKCAKVE